MALEFVFPSFFYALRKIYIIVSFVISVFFSLEEEESHVYFADYS